MSDKKSIYLFHGEDNYSSTQKLNFWKKEFIRKYGEAAHIEIFEGKEIKATEFITNLETLPFLAEKRFIIVKNIFAATKNEKQKETIKAVADSLDKTPDFCILIFHEIGAPDKRLSLYKKIQTLGTIEEFPALKPAEITNWIVKRAVEIGVNIDISTANYLAQHSGPELWTISNELDKLSAFAGTTNITKQMIDDLCVPSITASVFKLTDSIAGKNVKESLKVLKALEASGEDPFKTFFMIVRHFRILLQVQDMLSRNENQFSITKKLKQHPFVIQKTSQQAPNFNAKKLKAIYGKLLEIDVKVKTGVVRSYGSDAKEFHLEVEKFIIECCN